jgi:hypothetical protein
MNTRKNVTLWLALFVLVSLACGWINGVSPLSGNPPAGSNATQPPAMNVATPLSGNPPAGDLSGTEMLEIERVSFAAYPWRMKESVLVKDTQQTVTGLVEAQSATRVHVQSTQDINGNDVTIDTILIDATLYMKGTGGPAEYYQQFGAVEGQWMQVPPDHPLAAYAELARLAADPQKLVETLAKDFAALLNQSDMDQKLIKAIGSESVNGVSTSVYEYKGKVATYRWWVGGDRRLYKLSSDGALNATTILVEYDPSINIQPPIP